MLFMNMLECFLRVRQVMRLTSPHRVFVSSHSTHTGPHPPSAVPERNRHARWVPAREVDSPHQQDADAVSDDCQSPERKVTRVLSVCGRGELTFELGRRPIFHRVCDVHSQMNFIQRQLEDRDFPVYRIDGSVDQQTRILMISEFKRAASNAVFVIQVRRQWVGCR
jgi:hypothetical protein